MITTTIIQIVTDENNNVYDIGDRVRIKMKPSNADKPELANEHIGWIEDITEEAIYLATAVGVRKLYVEHIDKIRLASDGENFDNKCEF